MFGSSYICGPLPKETVSVYCQPHQKIIKLDGLASVLGREKSGDKSCSSNNPDLCDEYVQAANRLISVDLVNYKSFLVGPTVRMRRRFIGSSVQHHARAKRMGGLSLGGCKLST